MFNLECLHVLQEKALRLVRCVKYDSHSKPLFSMLCKLNIFRRNKIQIASLMHQIYYNILNITYITSSFNINAKINSQNVCTRGANNCYLPSARTNFRKFCIFHGPQIWNSIPQSIRDLKTLSSFKSSYRLHLINLDLWWVSNCFISYDSSIFVHSFNLIPCPISWLPRAKSIDIVLTFMIILTFSLYLN